MRRLFPLFCAAVISLSGCTTPGGPPARHLLLITLDTTRADRLGCYGHANAGTLALDRLAERGALFERAYASTPLTLPSHVSIFTGLYPPRTGVHVNGQIELDPRARPLAELLAEQGFYTAAAVGGYPVTGRFPVSRGFESFDDRMVDPHNPAGLEREAGEVVAAAMKLLGGRQDRRLFMWVHFFDPHDPYEPPPPFDSRYAGDRYQGEIARADAALADLLEELDARLGAEGLLVCVVGDHGEGLGDHGEPTHGFFLYESTMRVPFILAGPRVPEGRVVPESVRGVDILPTLLGLLGLPAPAGLDGVAIGLDEESSSPDRPIYIESELPYRHYGWSPLRGAVKGWLKYLEAPTPELYDLRRDPEERNNIAAQSPAEVAELAALVADVALSVDGEHIPLDPRLSALGYVSAGSAGGAGGSLADPKDKLDTYLRFIEANRLLEEGRPLQALPLLDALIEEEGTIGARFKRAQAWRMSGRLEQAEVELLRLEREDPSMAAVAFEIARIAIWTGRPALALEKLERYLAASPGDAEALMFRGAAREELGDPAGAETDYRHALALNPAFYGASLRLGALLLSSGRLQEARDHLMAHLRSYPDDDIARGLLDSME